MKSIGDFTGFSESGIDDALQNALQKANDPIDYEVIEILGSQDHDETNSQYQVTLRHIHKEKDTMTTTE